MTFNEIAQAIQDRNASWGQWPSLELAREIAVAEILEGFRDLDDAREWLVVFQDSGAVLFTAYGYEVSAQALEAAIGYREQEDSNDA